MFDRNRRNGKLSFKGELLEPRQLLAVDLVVEQLPALSSIEVGQPVTYQIQVTNNGPDNAIDAKITDPLTEYLDDATWTRNVVTTLQHDKLSPTQGMVVATDRLFASPVGDLNADGVVDHAVVGWNGLVHVFFNELTLDDGVVLLGSDGTLPSDLVLIGANGFSAIGDVNGDGVDDILVSNSIASFDPIPRARSAVLFGSSELGDLQRLAIAKDLDGKNGFRIVPNVNQVRHGDLNGDRVNDLVILDRESSLVTGFLGGPNLGVDGSLLVDSESHDPSQTVPIDMGRLACDVEVGDWNGDGLDDLLLAHAADERCEGYLLFGSEDIGDLGETQILEIEPERGGRLYTRARNLTSIGDVNGDGRDDFSLLVDTHFFGPNRGFILLGQANPPTQSLDLENLDGTDGFAIEGVERIPRNNRTIAALTPAGDVNNDGVDDLLVTIALFTTPHNGAPGIDPPPAVHVVFGKNNFGAGGEYVLGKSSNEFSFEAPLRFHGFSAVPVGDQNGDGIVDILVSQNQSRRLYEPISHLIYGLDPKPGDGGGVGDIDDSIDVRVGTTVTYTVSGTVKSGLAGRLVSRATAQPNPDQQELDPPTNSLLDADPDRIVDLVVEIDELPIEWTPGQAVNYGVRVRNEGQGGGTAARIEHSVPSEIENVTWVANYERTLSTESFPKGSVIALAGIEADNWQHERLTDAGDLNGDGLDDFAYVASENLAYVVFGGADLEDRLQEAALSDVAGVVVRGDAIAGVEGIGDFNGDGLDDLAVSYDSTNRAASIVFGRSELPDEIELDGLVSPNGIVLQREVGVSESPWLVGSAGDLNGDGKSDIYLGQILDYDKEETVYVLLGRESPESITVGDTSELGFVLTNLDPNGSRDFEIASGGDVNGDGLDDIVVGREWNGDNFIHQLEMGEVSILYGHADIGSQNDELTTAGFDKHLEETLYGLFSISIDGDLNGDGFDDILFGNHFGISVMLGAEFFDTMKLDRSTDSKICPYDCTTYYEVHPEYVGDSNGDGMDDFVISADRWAEDFEMYTRLIYGTGDLSSISSVIEDITADSVLPMEGMFGPTSAAGDVNADGIADVLVGNRVVFGQPTQVPDGAGDIDQTLDIPVGTTVSYQITGTLRPTAVRGVDLLATATSSENELEYRPQNNLRSASVSTRGSDIQVTVPHRRRNEDGSVTFVVEVRNDGTWKTPAVELAGVSEGLGEVRWLRETPNDGTQSTSGVAVPSHVLEIGAGETFRYEVTGIPVAGEEAQLTFSAELTQGQRDPNVANNVVTASFSAPNNADFNSDRLVDFADFLTLANNFGNSGAQSEGDADGNGTVNFLDFLILAQQFAA